MELAPLWLASVPLVLPDCPLLPLIEPVCEPLLCDPVELDPLLPEEPVWATAIPVVNNAAVAIASSLFFMSLLCSRKAARSGGARFRAWLNAPFEMVPCCSWLA